MFGLDTLLMSINCDYEEINNTRYTMRENFGFQFFTEQEVAIFNVHRLIQKMASINTIAYILISLTIDIDWK